MRQRPNQASVINARQPQGQSLLALVILIGGILLAIGVSLTVVTAAFVNSGYGYRSSEQAEAAAISGAEDALLQLDRLNNQFLSTGYTFMVGSSTATITVTQNSPSSGFVTVISASTISLRTRKIQVILSENQSTGQTSIVSWQEVQ